MGLPTKLQSGRKLKVVSQALWLVWACVHGYVLSNYGVAMKEIIADSVISNAFIGAAGLLIYNNMRFYVPKTDQQWYILGLSVVLSLLSTGIATTLLHLIFFKDTYYISMLSNSWLIRFSTAFLLIGCISLVSLLLNLVQEQNEAVARKREAEQMLKNAELYKLRQQLQPHFLFNSLNSISALTISDTERARNMIQQLSDFLRGTLKRDEVQLIPLQDELSHLQLYLDIEKVRFGHRLETNITCTEVAAVLKLPALLLQPVVENAIKFGLYDTIDDITIDITAVEEKNALVVSITNPFDSDSSQPSTGTGFGLESIRRRLYLLYARYDLLETSFKDNHFTATLTIPQV